MRLSLILVASAALSISLATPQTAPPAALLTQQDAEQLAARMLQLMESTAVAVPGLTRASEPLKQDADATLASLLRTPENAALPYRLINQIKAYLALSDSMPRPTPFPPAADQQYAELREGLQRLQRHFEASLESQNQTAQKRDTDPNGLKRYGEADTKMLPPSKMPRVVFLGDSITEQWRLNEYFTGRDFVNRGIGDQTTTQILARFRQDVAGLNPKAVMVLAGTNDIGAGIPLNQITDNLAAIGDLAKAHGIKALFASVTPVNDYHKGADPRYEVTPTHPLAAIQTLNRWIQSYCLSQGFFYLDYYAVMIDSSGQMQADLSDDGLHPNAKGYRVMSPVALNAIDRVLGAQPEPEESKRRFRLLGK